MLEAVVATVVVVVAVVEVVTLVLSDMILHKKIGMYIKENFSTTYLIFTYL